MTTPNTTLQAARKARRLSQDELARLLRDAGAQDASKRLVQRWESGVSQAPRPLYARALEAVFGQPVEALGFSAVPGQSPGEMPTAQPGGTHSGVWLSRYEYPSSSRAGVYVGQHHVLVLQHGDRLTVKALPDNGSDLSMDLSVDGAVVTGTWVEVTAVDGYYRGARYHGTIQMVVDPTGRRMAGMWAGFGRDMEINTGPWTLEFLSASTAPKTIEAYSRPPE
jgi:transcriptional regulator with XRE-family HTH domain